MGQLFGTNEGCTAMVGEGGVSKYANAKVVWEVGRWDDEEEGGDLSSWSRQDD